MREIDARGLSCPEPLMMAHQAIMSNELPVKIMVDEVYQKTNIEKLVKNSKKSSVANDCGSYIEIVIE